MESQGKAGNTYTADVTLRDRHYPQRRGPPYRLTTAELVHQQNDQTSERGEKNEGSKRAPKDQTQPCPGHCATFLHAETLCLPPPYSSLAVQEGGMEVLAARVQRTRDTVRQSVVGVTDQVPQGPNSLKTA